VSVSEVGSTRQLRALATANLRFWPTVAPAMWRSLSHWREVAAQIPDAGLRRSALEKLDEEAFNAEVAATLATLAPRGVRGQAVEAIVALEVLFDYLDGRTEELAGHADPVGESMRLFAAMTGALGGQDAGEAPAATEADRATREAATLSPEGAGRAPGALGADGAYLAALSEFVAARVARLASFTAAREPALAAAVRCAEAQSRLHAATRLGDGQLERWARAQCAGSGLEWREYAGGCASSVLAVHALIATAARPGFSAGEAQALDRAYIATGALITMLDSSVDETADRERGEPGYIRLFEPGERAERARALARLAAARSSEAPDPAHHAMTLAGVAAYYASHPGARGAAARPVMAAVGEELGAGMRPTLAVMQLWRAAKVARGRIRRGLGRGQRANALGGAEEEATDLQ
jgi:hypothetical protein